MTKSQKVWVKPELIILVRSKPEEAVLIACKGGGTPSPLSQGGLCTGLFGGFCLECFVNSSS